MVDEVTAWTSNSNDLRTKGWNIASRPKWESMAGFRGSHLEIAYMDGVELATGLPYRENVLTFDMVIWGRNPSTGAITLGSAWEHLEQNVDTVKSYFPESVDLRRTLADGSSIRQALGRAVTGAPVRDYATTYGQILLMPVAVLVPEGTFRDITDGTDGETDDTNTGLSGTGSVDIDVGGNAHTAPIITVSASTEVSDFSLTFPDGAVLDFSDNDATIPAGQDLVLDCQTRQVTLDGAYADAGLASTSRAARWAWLDGDETNTIDYSSSAGTFDLTFEWYDRWR